MKKHPTPGAVPRARALRTRATDAERRLWRALREHLPTIHFRRQVPFGPYVTDFCCHAEKLIVELDGGQHTPEGDSKRTAFLESEGYRLLRFWNSDALVRTLDVIATIQRELRGCHPTLSLPIKGEGTPLLHRPDESLPLRWGRLGGGDAAGESAPQ